MLESFVRVRGGGLIALGGRKAFAEGDYYNTAVADVIPLVIDPGRRTVIPPDFTRPEEEPERQGFTFEPTAVGLEKSYSEVITGQRREPGLVEHHAGPDESKLYGQSETWRSGAGREAGG